MNNNPQTNLPNSLDGVHQNKIAVNNTLTFATTADVKQWIKSQAQALGFADCGFLIRTSPFIY